MRHNFPYMLGVYLAINAMPDACLIVDGPDCSFFKGEYIYGNHDLRSTLLNAAGYGRIIYTDVTFQNIVLDRSNDILRTLSDAVQRGGFPLIFLTGMPMTTITDVQYEPLISKLRLSEGSSVITLPGKSLTHDWLGGYAQTLTTLAESLPRRARARNNRRDSVAIVGHFMHRNEADEQANVAELRRIFGALGLDVVSIWPGGETYASMQNVRDAGTIISLPFGRNAARVLAEKFKATLVEVDVPFGFENTKRFVRTIAEHCGQDAKAEEFIDSELRECVPALERIIPRLFLHKKTFYAGAPHMLDGFLDLARMTGMQVLGASLACAEGFRDQNILWPAADMPELFYEIQWEQWVKKEPSIASRADVIVTDGSLPFSPDAPIVEFGFPSYFSHAISPSPCLGFRGALCFLDRLADCLFRKLRVSEAETNMNIFGALNRTKSRNRK